MSAVASLTLVSTGCRLRHSPVTWQLMTEGLDNLWNSPAPITAALHILLVITRFSVDPAQESGLSFSTSFHKPHGVPSAPHTVAITRMQSEDNKVGMTEIIICRLAARCRLIQFEFWQFGSKTQSHSTHSHNGTQFYCILSPPFEISTDGEKYIVLTTQTTKLTTGVTLVLFSLHVVTRVQNIYCV